MNAQMAITQVPKVDEYSKSVGTVKRLNAQEWTPQMMNVEGIQEITSDNYLVIIDWKCSTIEILGQEYKYAKCCNGISQILELEEKSPEVGTVNLIFNTEGVITQIKFIEKQLKK
jgi:hypothetical protein